MRKYLLVEGALRFLIANHLTVLCPVFSIIKFCEHTNNRIACDVRGVIVLYGLDFFSISIVVLSCSQLYVKIRFASVECWNKLCILLNYIIIYTILKVK